MAPPLAAVDIVLCTCSLGAAVPAFLVGTGKGWLTAEYNMHAGGEEATFSDEQLGSLLKLGKQGIEQITTAQRQALGSDWPV